MDLAVINMDSLHGYRQRMKYSRPGHVWEQLDDETFLQRIGAAGNGVAVILKNNKPRYLIINFDASESMQTASTERVTEISKKLLKQNRIAYEELAK